MTATDDRVTVLPAAGGLSLARCLEILVGDRVPLRFTAYDGSATGPDDGLGVELLSPRGTTYLATAPGELGLVRAYVSGDLQLHGVHPGDPYQLLKALSVLRVRRPTVRVLADIVRSIGIERLVPIAPPPEEVPPRWRRTAHGLRHSRRRDSEAIRHHYDVSNSFYRRMLGPSMTYSCAHYPHADASLEEAQADKHRLVFDKLRLQPGDRLLDIGCGWGSMVRYAARRGVQTTGITLSAEQAAWAQEAVAEEGLTGLAEIREGDYRDIPETEFDAVTSIGMIEHVGVAHYPAYFRFLRSKLRIGGLLLNQGITHSDNTTALATHGLIDRYVFPDGELTGSGRIITEAQDAGLEVLHEENLRPHYAMTLRDWCANLVEHWDQVVSEVGIGTARVWGLYMAGARLEFERNVVQLHQVLAVNANERTGAVDLPLRPWWQP